MRPGLQVGLWPRVEERADLALDGASVQRALLDLRAAAMLVPRRVVHWELAQQHSVVRVRLDGSPVGLVHVGASSEGVDDGSRHLLAC